MRSRTYIIDGNGMVFDKDSFRRLFNSYCKSHKLNYSDAEQEIADKIPVSKETIHKWRGSSINPNDDTTIKKLAKAMEITDFRVLLATVDKGEKMDIDDENVVVEKYTDRQITAIKKIYDSCVWFLNEFNKSNGFNDYWDTFKEDPNPEQAIIKYADDLLDKVGLVVDQEYFDLRGTEIYNELSEFACIDLTDIYYTKVSHEYRYEAITDGNPTTNDDYSKALHKLNTIIKIFMG